jgi:hypothetical protein
MCCRNVACYVSKKAKPGWLARLFSFITLWGLTWF